MKGWYIEKYDSEGVRFFAEDCHSFGDAVAAVHERGNNGIVRFIAPAGATPDQISSLKTLGAVPT